MKKVLSLLRRADQDFGMIQSGDRVMVGVSGGKDSLLLLTALHEYQRFSDHPFELFAGMVDLGYEDHDETVLHDYCASVGVELDVKHTKIGRVLFETRKEKNPCSLCAKMRRGSLNELALRRGCNKVALGHHRDDLVETLLMSLIYESRMRTFAPVTWMDRVDIVQIRPLVYLEERHIVNVQKKLTLPVVHNACPACGNTKRQEMKELVAELRKNCKDADNHIFNAIKNTANYDLWDTISYRPDAGH